MDIFELLEEIREWLGGNVIPEKDLDGYLAGKGFSVDDINYIKGEMLNNKFSFMNNTVSYRGDYVAKMLPDQNPTSHKN